MTYLGETLFEERDGSERRTVWYGGLLGSFGPAAAQHYTRTPEERAAMEQASRNNAEALLLSMRGAQNAYQSSPPSPSIDEVARFLRVESKRLGSEALDHFVVWAAVLVFVALAVASLRGHW